MAGVTKLTQLNLGKETVSGTDAAATVKWLGPYSFVDKGDPVFNQENIGRMWTRNRSHIPMTGVDITIESTEASYELLPILFNLAFGEATEQADNTSWYSQWTMPTTAVQTPTTATIEYGDNSSVAANSIKQSTYCYIKDITLTGAGRGAVMVSANLGGRGVSTESAFTSISPFTVETINFGGGSLTIDDTAVYTTAKTVTLMGYTITFNPGWMEIPSIERKDYTSLKQVNPSISGQLRFEHNATAIDAVAQKEAETIQYIQIQHLGTAITGTSHENKKLRMQLPVRYTKVSSLESDNGNNVVTVDFITVDDLSANPGTVLIAHDNADVWAGA